MTPTSISPADRIARAALFMALVACIFVLPQKPEIDVDPSWRMALAQFFHDGLQFGRDVVFTYGPLGFMMGKTYYGLYFGSLVVWQVFWAVVFAALIFMQARDLGGYARLGYFAFFLLFGVLAQDVLSMIMIAMMGFMLIRDGDGRGAAGRAGPVIAVLLAVLALAKFTHLMLGAFAVGTAAAHAFWTTRSRAALRLPLWFAGAYIVGWVLCGQNPLNLPAYIGNSLEISMGYEAAMGIATPTARFWEALAVMALLAAYVALYVKQHPDRPRALANAALLAAFIFLSWKHGFVRSDGHTIGFFICALLPAAAFPVLLGDSRAAAGIQRCVLAAAAVLCVLGVYDSHPQLVRAALGVMQEKIWSTVQQVSNGSATREAYRESLVAATAAADLPSSRQAIAKGSVDVMGHFQAVALLNGLNYRPRPVFQSYSAYTPRLARLNQDFYAGPDAPDFALVRLQPIDGKLATFDDSMVYPLLVQRYEYVHTEKEFQLWRRRGERFDAATVEPRPWRSQEVALNQSFSIEEGAQQPLWASLDLRLSLLGRLRSFLYKPPFLFLAVEDAQGGRSAFRLPLPEAQAGFILNPLVEDANGFLQFAADKPGRRIRRITAQVAPEDTVYFKPTFNLTLSLLKPSTGLKSFPQVERPQFNLFRTVPIAYEAHTPPKPAAIAGQPVLMMHAPSDMTFDAPAGTKRVSGQFGLMEGAYTQGGKSNGAEFVVYWSKGSERVNLHRRFLDPARVPADAGLHSFNVEVPAGSSGGQVHLQVLPGPDNNNNWDWSAWTAVEVK